MPTEILTEVLNRTYYERATGRLGDAEATLRWVCAQAGVHPSDHAVRAAVASRHRAVRADTWLRADAVPVLAALRQRGLRTGVISDCTQDCRPSCRSSRSPPCSTYGSSRCRSGGANRIRRST